MAYIFLIEHNKWAMQRISGRGFENWTWPSANVAKKGRRVYGREERPWWGGGGLKVIWTIFDTCLPAENILI